MYRTVLILVGLVLFTTGSSRLFSIPAASQQAHRHAQEEKENAVNSRIAESNIRSQDASISEIKRGQWMAYSLGLIFLGITVMLGLNGHEVAASTLGLGGVAAVATVFIKVRNKQ